MLKSTENRRDVAWYPVRCCCQPLKIFGFIRLEVSRNKFKIMDERGQAHEVELRRMYDARADIDIAAESDVTTISLETAIYSDDRPIEFWRTIPGFVEVS